MFETVGTMFGEMNILQIGTNGVGIAFMAIGLILAIARGITRSREDMLFYSIIIGNFGVILLFNESIEKTILFIVVYTMVLAYAIFWFKQKTETLEDVI